ncbi:hypothetical protein [Caminibacter sp.]
MKKFGLIILIGFFAGLYAADDVICPQGDYYNAVSNKCVTVDNHSTNVKEKNEKK